MMNGTTLDASTFAYADAAYTRYLRHCSIYSLVPQSFYYWLQSA